MSDEVREVLDTCRVAAQLGKDNLGAYVISMTRGAADVLCVELLQREALLQVRGGGQGQGRCWHAVRGAATEGGLVASEGGRAGGQAGV